MSEIEEVTAQPLDRTDTLTFLRKILPSRGHYFVATLQQGKERPWFRHFGCDTREEAAQRAMLLDASCENVYYACSSYREPFIIVKDSKTGEDKQRQRVHDNVLLVRSFWLDLDVKNEPSAYQTQQEAIVGLGEFLRASGLPVPLVVSSGNGLHCYWPLTEDILPPQWLAAARLLKSLATKLGLKQDASRTSDHASVLRPIGTYNRKDPQAPKLVELVRDAEPIGYGELYGLLESACRSQGVVAPQGPKLLDGSDLNARFLVPKSYPPADPNEIANRCAQIRLMRDTKGRISEPHWYTAIQVLTHAVDGDSVIHEWSSGHADYSKDETERKIVQARQYGPASCSTFASRNPGGCDGCPYLDHISSPIVLGSSSAAYVNPMGPSETQPAQTPPFDRSLETLTDTGNSWRLVRLCADRIRYVHDIGQWIIWDGSRWLFDTDKRIIELAKATGRSIYDEASVEPNADMRAKLGRFAAATESYQRIVAMTRLAESNPRVALHAYRLDCDPELLLVENGLVDLRTGHLLEPSKEKYITKRAQVTFDDAADCPVWRRFLSRVLGDDPALVAYIQRVVGYALSGKTSEQCLFFLYGSGQNGKSTFIGTVQRLLGDYATTCAPETLMVKQYAGGATNDIARLRGARLVVASEVEDGARLAENQVKLMTGQDVITARFLYKEHFQFAPEFKLFIVGNHKPIIRGNDHAIWRRIKLIPFTVQIPENEKDPSLSERLLGELPGILNWALEGYRAYLATGLQTPDIVSRAIDDYRAEMDLVGQWLVDRCVVADNSRPGARAQFLYEDYQQWAKSMGYTPLSNVRFGKQLGDHTHGAKVKRSDGWYYPEIALVPRLATLH